MADREVIRFRMLLSKKTAKLTQESLENFARDVIKEFGGTSLLGQVEIKGSRENIIEIITSRSITAIIHGAFLLCGEYKTLKCCFRLI